MGNTQCGCADKKNVHIDEIGQVHKSRKKVSSERALTQIQSSRSKKGKVVLMEDPALLMNEDIESKHTIEPQSMPHFQSPGDGPSKLGDV